MAWLLDWMEEVCFRKVLPLLNRWIEAAQKKGIPIYASCDWHLVRHPSFKAEAGNILHIGLRVAPPDIAAAEMVFSLIQVF